jgi:YbbR domain-containing protein
VVALKPNWKRDIGIRLLALALAVALWFVASEDLRTEPVAMEERVLPATVRLVGVAKELIPFQDVPQVEVRLRGPSNVPVPEQLEAYIDMRGKRAGQYHLAVHVSVPSRFSVLAVKPEHIAVRLEPETTRRFSVVTALIGLPPGVEVVIGQPEPAEVTVSGAKSDIERVARVYAIATYDTSEDSVLTEVRVVDGTDRDVADLTIEPTQVRVVMNTKSPPAEPELPEPETPLPSPPKAEAQPPGATRFTGR